MNELPYCSKCGVFLTADAPAGLCPKCLVQAGFESQPSTPVNPKPTAPSPTGSGFEPPSIEELSDKFPHLEILELLGKGGMGAVYKARQPRLDRLVAVKILPSAAAQDPGFTERFTREARAMAKLNHPNIVAIHDIGQAGELTYFVMEFVDGTNLRQAMRASQLQPQQALSVVSQICEALQFAHDEGVVHRDIKPENILLDKRGRVKIADFGLSKLIGDSDSPDFSLTGTHQVMGTIRYMAPEQMQGTKGVDHRADLYSLGVVFYEMLTGELPVGRFPLPSEKVRVDVRLDDVVVRTLEKEPDLRYQHASEIKQQVDMISSSGSTADGAKGEPGSNQAGMSAPEQTSSSWLSNIWGNHSKRTKHVFQGIQVVLGAAASVLFLAMFFDLINTSYALFGAIACMIVSGYVTSFGNEISPGDSETLVNVSTKLKAALAMGHCPERERLLTEAAHEAVEEGDSKASLLAMQAINDVQLHDETAATCALQIAENEGVDEAIPVAQIIYEVTCRNQVLQKLAEM